MTAQVLLLRGINVGGHGKLPMADLRAHLLALGAGEARTYIQSGNCVCRTAVDPDALAERIASAQGFRPMVFARDAEAWRAALAPDPFPDADPRQVHLFFHGSADALPAGPLSDNAAPTERLACTAGVIWLLAPDGIGRSKLAASVEQRAGVPLTARNLRTVRATTALLEGME